MTNYKLHVGQRVRHNITGTQGTVDSMVPGNGTIEWYYVEWDNSTTDSNERYTSDEIQAI